ncbi:MAG: GIY-YIG nuclease family protein [Pseudomonadota bacterium]|nr:GIY-YIG nuclease family protein [Pseudomonadota bacterium]
MSELSNEDLLAALGVDIAPLKPAAHTALEERLIAGFEDIQRFVDSHGRAPLHGEDRDIFERLYAVRLDRLRAMAGARELLAALDTQGILAPPAAGMDAATAAELDDATLLAQLGINAEPVANDITQLRHVRSYAERQAAEAIAERMPCEDFERFAPLFAEAHAGLQAGTWMSKTFARDASIDIGDFFIVNGQTVYVADVLEANTTRDGRNNPRLRLIFDNGTEGDLLLRSLSRSLYPDGDTPVGRRLIRKDDGPLFAATGDADIAGPEAAASAMFGDTLQADDIINGTIYVLRSLSDHPYVAAHREVIHKIGVTGGKVQSRIAKAASDPTYLMAAVEVVATYQLAQINRGKLERLFHRLFQSARLDLSIEDRFGKPVKPQEWYVLPFDVIDEAVRRIVDGSITAYAYSPQQAALIAAD